MTQLQTAPNSSLPLPAFGKKLATDPPVSEKQRRAMYAAAAGKSTLGIPKKVGKEFVGADATAGHAAGVLFVAPDGDVLLLRRSSSEPNYGGHWALPGGKADDGESPEQAADREVSEEIGGKPPGAKKLIDQVVTPRGMAFHTYAQPVEKKFQPRLNDEHSGYAWAPIDQLPQPLHPGVAATLSNRLGVSEDMEPEDWAVLAENFLKWIAEEAEEDEHAEDDVHAAKVSLEMPDATAKLAPTKPEGVRTGKDEKLTKASVNYGKSTTNERCGNCVHFRSGFCEIVAGDINKDDWCNQYSFAAPFGAMDRYAFDRASVRNTDADGRLHVAVTNISKANVCPYLGKEINEVMKDTDGWKMLQDDKIYHLLRHPEELRKAASTFNNLPLLSTHKPVNALNHEPDLIIGSTGTDAKFSHPYLMNSLVVWVQDAINAIESETQKELSSSYRYKADMTPGNYEGADYDGIMRDIVGNHVALVKEGRAGNDVVVGDSKETINKHQESTKMKVKLSRKALLAHGALMGFLGPKLAQDTKLPDLAPVLKDVTAKNYIEKKPAIFDGVKAALKDVKLAKDANLDDMHGFLDSLDKHGDDEEPDPDQKAVDADPDDKDEKKAFDAEGLKNFLKDKVSEDAMKALDAYLAGDDPPAFAGKPVKGGEDEEEEKVDKKAMDEAIKQATKVATDAATKIQRDIRDAEKKVQPWVGSLAITCDSADQVYRTALEMLGVKGIKDVHASALPILLDMQPKPGERKSGETPSFAMDASSVEGFHKRVPGAARISILG